MSLNPALNPQPEIPRRTELRELSCPPVAQGVRSYLDRCNDAAVKAAKICCRNVETANVVQIFNTQPQRAAAPNTERISNVDRTSPQRIAARTAEPQPIQNSVNVLSAQENIIVAGFYSKISTLMRGSTEHAPLPEAVAKLHVLQLAQKAAQSNPAITPKVLTHIAQFKGRSETRSDAQTVNA